MAGDKEFFGGVVRRSPDGLTFTEIRGVKGVKIPELSIDMKTRKSLDSPDRVVRKRPGWADPGEFEIVVYDDEGDIDEAMADQARTLSGASTFYEIEFATGKKWAFESFPMVTPPAPSEVDVDIEFTIKGAVSGLPEFTPAA
ncbi:phage tail tube protein [Celeribacter ethanolicus]|uniref:phage tail tube protein n=1 Tax=Celeribacter ethanolicus TaxID=1758178 RepID=UPI00082E82A1|nr:phage tail tube protein [Celeribacter ethanolicus]